MTRSELAIAFKIPNAENVPTALILCFLLVSLGLPEITVIERRPLLYE